MPFDASAWSLPWLILAFVACAAVIASAGVAVTHRADRIADRTGFGEALVGAVLVGGSTSLAGVDRTGLDETAVGGLLTGTATSLPELVTTVAAVRQGALTRALGGLVGGNVFDMLFLAFSDVAFRARDRSTTISSSATCS